MYNIAKFIYIDIDECGITGSCEQDCTNKNGSFVCSCRTGYDLDDNSRTCNGTSMRCF